MFLFSKRCATYRRLTGRMRPHLEALEGRVVLSTFNVNTTLDTVAVNLKTGQDAMGHISLRSAIMAADARGGSNTIRLPAGDYLLTIPPAGNDGAATGDLNIKNNNLTIEGVGAASTIIDGGNRGLHAALADRIFDIQGSKVSISGVTIEGGEATMGGGILNSGGSVTIASCVLQFNQAVGQSGAAGLPGASTTGLDGSSTAPNGTDAAGTSGSAGTNGGNGLGGGVCNLAGSLTIENSVIASNLATGGPGGRGADGGNGQGGNGAAGGSGGNATGGSGGAGGDGGEGLGGGVFNAAGASLVVVGSTFSSDVASGGGGGQGGSGGYAIGGNGGTGSPAGGGGNGTAGTGADGGPGGRGQGGAVYNAGAATFSGATTTFSKNLAYGGAGGSGGGAYLVSNMSTLGAGGAGGAGSGGAGGAAGGTGQGAQVGAGGQGGEADGGAIANTGAGSLKIVSAVSFLMNEADGGSGGSGSWSAEAYGGNGGAGDGNGAGGGGGSGLDDPGGQGGSGGLAQGGAVFNDFHAVISIMPNKSAKSSSPPASTFTGNLAIGGTGGLGGSGSGAEGGSGNKGGALGQGGSGNEAGGGNGAGGGDGGAAEGGGLANDGTATFTGITVNFLQNQAIGSAGGGSGSGGESFGGGGGSGTTGGNGGNCITGRGASGGNGLSGLGGAIYDAGSLTIDPRKGAQKQSNQANATSTITNNQASEGQGGPSGSIGQDVVGLGGMPGGSNGTGSFALYPFPARPGQGVGGGIYIAGQNTNQKVVAIVRNTTISGNQASTSNNDIFGMLSS